MELAATGIAVGPVVERMVSVMSLKDGVKRVNQGGQEDHVNIVSGS